MKGNDFQLCGWTPSHLGWGTGVGGNPALKQDLGDLDVRQAATQGVERGRSQDREGL